MLSRELVRAVRGRRSQVALSRRLGFKTNVVYTWECGRSEPTALQLFEVVRRGRHTPAELLGGFYRQRPAWLGVKLERATFAAFLEQERRGITLVAIARETGVNRFSLARYLRADADIKLADLLRVIDYCTHRLLDFLALWVDPAELPGVEGAWRNLLLARRTAYELPWSHAVLRCLELKSYLEAPRHAKGFIAKQLGIAQQQEDACLELLQHGQQITWTGSHWRGVQNSSISLDAGPGATKKQAAWWVAVAAERAKSQRGMFAYNVCCVSAKDLQRIAELERECLRQVRDIVAESTPGERVALINVQVMAFDAPRDVVAG